MQLSFIIPIHNAEKTLKTCLDSILKLRLEAQDFEIIAVNNGSTDKSAALLAEYDQVFTLNFSWASRSRARNAGAMHARGPWCVFIDADVELEEDFAAHLLRSISNTPALIYHGPVIPANTDGQDRLNRYRYHLAHLKTGGTFSLYFINVRESPMINSAACVYQREFFYELGGFDERLERHEDIDLSKRASLEAGSIHYIPQARAFVHYHDQGWWAYGVRAFREGMTKIDYLAKWQGVFKTQPFEMDAQLRQAFRWDRYTFLRALHLLIRLAGRVLGHLFREPRYTPLDQTPKLQYTERPD